ncbi:MAG: hypothetical protein AAFU41_02180 [Pseudomonadota bacterium]
MSRFVFALTAAAFVGIAAPASAGSFGVNLPHLTFPPQPTPDVSQGCSDVTSVSGSACVTPAK